MNGTTNFRGHAELVSASLKPGWLKQPYVTLKQVQGDLSWCLLFLCAGFLLSCHAPEQVAAVRGDSWAKKVEAKNLQNFYQVDEVLFRSEQPSSLAMREVGQNGIKTIVNLRSVKNDPQSADVKLKWEHVRINTWTISYNDVLKALRVIDKAEKPVLVHCKHGSDRTGCVVAAWCMVKHNYSKEQAIEELRHGGYHFHERYFKNIIRLVEALNVEQLRKDLQDL